MGRVGFGPSCPAPDHLYLSTGATAKFDHVTYGGLDNNFEEKNLVHFSFIFHWKLSLVS